MTPAGPAAPEGGPSARLRRATCRSRPLGATTWRDRRPATLPAPNVPGPARGTHPALTQERSQRRARTRPMNSVLSHRRMAGARAQRSTSRKTAAPDGRQCRRWRTEGSERLALGQHKFRMADDQSAISRQQGARSSRVLPADSKTIQGQLRSDSIPISAGDISDCWS